MIETQMTVLKYSEIITPMIHSKREEILGKLIIDHLLWDREWMLKMKIGC